MSVDIHISNYEEYLYSYVDGELTPEESAALELFLDQHPHLRAELDQLMATRLQPEDLVFSNKAALYKSSQPQAESYETQLLSYMDGELDPQAARGLERFMEDHPQLRQELELWKKTRLVPDMNLRFENKSVLYRSNARTVRIRPAYWWAAAAMLAGALFMLRNTFNQDNIVTPPVAVNQSSQNTAPAVESTQPAAPAPESGETQRQNVTASAQDNAADVQAEPNTSKASRPVLARADNNASGSDAAAPDVREPEQTVAAADLSSLRTQPVAEPAARTAVSADLSGSIPKVKTGEAMLAANNKPSIDIQAAATLATPPPAKEPGELIMSVTGNGVESKVLDKVANVAKLFARKRNK